MISFPDVALVLALASTLGASPSFAAGADAPPIKLDSHLGLFVDHYLIERMKDAQLQLHRPIPGGIVFTFDKPWEGGLSAYVSILKDGDEYRMYYRGGGDLVREHTCLALSKDGTHWTRPNLGLFAFDGSKANNIIWTGKDKAYCESHNFTPFIDTNPACKKEERYKAVTMTRIKPKPDEKKNVLLALVSADGIHWKKLREEPIITEGGFDSQNAMFYDVVGKEYVCYLRASQKGKKSIARATSKDFVNWTQPVLLDFGDSVPEHLYTNGIVQYFREPEMYLGFPLRFIHPNERHTVGLEQRKTDGFSDAVFMSSRDGMHWDRTFMEAFIRPGPDPLNWGGAHANLTPARGIVPINNQEIAIYWADHYDNYPKKDLIPRFVARDRSDGRVQFGELPLSRRGDGDQATRVQREDPGNQLRDVGARRGAGGNSGRRRPAFAGVRVGGLPRVLGRRNRSRGYVEERQGRGQAGGQARPAAIHHEGRGSVLHSIRGVSPCEDGSGYCFLRRAE